MIKNPKITKATEQLWKNQSEKNWKAFSNALKGSPVKYYRIIFANEGKLNKMQDLTKSTAELYDSKYNLVTTVPVFKTQGKRLRGATIYLMGLSVYNKVSK